MGKQRETELDILRILALLAVILVHACGMETHTLPVTDRNWQVLTFCAAIVTWQIPIYVMISGRFFLDPEREMPFRKILKSIWRLVVAFVVWDVVYQIYYIWSGAYGDLNWKGILSQTLVGPYHFWYLHMLIWLYAIVPFLRKIAESKKMMEYFILLFLLFEFLANYGVNLPLAGSTINEVLVKTNFHFALGYSGYYILGYYLYKYKIPDKLEIPLYIAGIVLLIFAGTATVWRAAREGVNNDWYSKYLLPNIAIEASALYTFFVKRVGKHKSSDRAVRGITKLSEYSFGVYLIHALVIEFLGLVGITPIIFSPFLMLPAITLLTFVISNVLVGLLRKIPRIGKKIT